MFITNINLFLNVEIIEPETKRAIHNQGEVFKPEDGSPNLFLWQ